MSQNAIAIENLQTAIKSVKTIRLTPDARLDPVEKHLDMRYTGRTLGVMLALLGMALPPQWIFAQVSKPAPAVARSGDAVLARVDGQTIKNSDLERMFKSRRVEPDLQPKVRDEFLDQLIDMLLMQKFLKAQKITVADSELVIDVTDDGVGGADVATGTGNAALANGTSPPCASKSATDKT